jgi:anti-sigma factor RsiW
MACVRRRSPWETFLDGELPAAQMLELQAHVDVCSECANEVSFSQAIRVATRQTVLGAAGLDDQERSEAEQDAASRHGAGLSDAFRARLSSALAREGELERQEQTSAQLRRLLRQWVPRAGALAVSSAAAVVLWVRSDGVEPTTDVGGRVSSVRDTQSSVLEPEELLDRLIDYHSAPPEPQVTRQELVPQLEADVGVRMPLLNLTRYGATWQGGSVVRVRDDRSAAYFRYRTLDDHKVTVYVYNASRLPLHASLEPRMFREEPVYEGYRRGYTIVAQLRRGVGYAVATDLDEPISAELVQAISRSAVAH